MANSSENTPEVKPGDQIRADAKNRIAVQHNVTDGNRQP